MQRVRIGLTGLAFVFLVVLLAAVLTSGPAEEEPITPNLIEQQLLPPAAETAVKEKERTEEPLAELGVAPGRVENSVTEEENPAASAE